MSKIMDLIVQVVTSSSSYYQSEELGILQSSSKVIEYELSGLEIVFRELL